MLIRLLLCGALALAAVSTQAAVKIYFYLDADGVRHYTDQPDNSLYQRLYLSPRDRTQSGQHYDPALLARRAQYDPIIENAAASAAVESDLLRAVILVESGYNSHALSKRGAVGLMQLMPATASRFGVLDLYDPRENVRAGAQYLKFLMDRFGQDVKLALAAYNAGEEAVDRSGGRIPPYAETQAYVPKVMAAYRLLSGEHGRIT
jgi:soluble lytic murein transglycosylase-like protein